MLYIYKTLINILHVASHLVVRLVAFPLSRCISIKTKLKFVFMILKVQNSAPIELVVNRGDTAVQVGTPRERTVLRYLKAVGREGRVVVVEAALLNYKKLVNSPTLNKYNNLLIINAAAWSETKMGELQISSVYSGDHKIHTPNIVVDNDRRAGNEKMGIQSCQFYALDDLFNNIGLTSVDYLAVTVNGAELEVLRGCKAMLTNKKISRVYAKGHCKDADGVPLQKPIAELFAAIGYQVQFSKGEPSTSTDLTWTKRSGDIFAFIPEIRSK